MAILNGCWSASCVHLCKVVCSCCSCFWKDTTWSRLSHNGTWSWLKLFLWQKKIVTFSPRWHVIYNNIPLCFIPQKEHALSTMARVLFVFVIQLFDPIHFFRNLSQCFLFHLKKKVTHVFSHDSTCSQISIFCLAVLCDHVFATIATWFLCDRVFATIARVHFCIQSSFHQLYIKSFHLLLATFYNYLIVSLGQEKMDHILATIACVQKYLFLCLLY